MKLFVLLGILCFAGAVNAKPPYEFYEEANAKDFSGKAFILGAPGWRYVGDVKAGKPHGNGVKILNGGMVLYGEWIEGVFKGDGAIYSPAPFDSLEAGTYDYNQIVSGEGVIHIEGEVYQGPYGRLGLPDGTGVCTKSGEEKPCTYKMGEKVE